VSNLISKILSTYRVRFEGLASSDPPTPTTQNIQNFITMDIAPPTRVDHLHFSDGICTPIDKRQAARIRGLIPAAYLSLELNVERCMIQLRAKKCSIGKYIFLQTIQDTMETLYFAMLIKHTDELMPIIYTPTVGTACEEFSHIYRGTLRGMYFSLNDKGMIRELLDNWPGHGVTTIVVTDGERILGLGDMGTNGMAIPIGKLAIYTACAGIPPSQVLPVQLDVGTNNQANLDDPYYLGLRQERERGPAYDELIADFFDAIHDKFGKNTMIQFEDFGNSNAFRLLKKYQDAACCFNDDIQGTAAVALAGLISSGRLTGKKLADHRFLFFGAGEAGTGIADLIAYAVSIEKKISVQEARKNIFFVDSKGLVTKSRLSSLQTHKLNYAHDIDCDGSDLMSALDFLKPTCLMGVSAQPKTFTKEICQKMSDWNDHPIICALSNPTSKAECTAEEAYLWTDGTVIFSSGSPCDPVVLPDGRRFVPGQGNNAYIFPGVGLGVLAAGSTRITNHDFLLAAETLADQVSQEQLDTGCVYPPLSEIRSVSSQIAVAIVENAHETGVATKPKPTDMMAYVKSLMYDPFAM